MNVCFSRRNEKKMHTPGVLFHEYTPSDKCKQKKKKKYIMYTKVLILFYLFACFSLFVTLGQLAKCIGFSLFVQLL